MRFLKGKCDLMSRLRNYAHFVLVGSLFCWGAISDAEAASKADIEIILNRFPGYHVLTLQERDSDARTFIKSHFANQNSSVVHADFDGDGHPDYAILLKNKKSGTAKLAVLLCSGDSDCKTVHEEDVTSSSGEVFIRPLKIGSRVSQTDAIDTKDYPPPVRLRSTGIEVTYFGQAKVVYYWSRKHKKMETIQTED